MHGMQSPSPVRCRRRKLILPIAALAVAGAWALSESGVMAAAPGAAASGVVHAGGGFVYDYDYDGLTDLVEGVLGSDPYHPDSDRDGFTDLEEFARGSHPGQAQSRPLPGSLGLSVSASGEADGPHLQVATYFTDGTLNNKNFNFGVVVDGTFRMLPDLVRQQGVRVELHDASTRRGQVLIMDIPIAEGFIHSAGQASFFATLNVDGSPVIDAADGVDLVSDHGIVHVVLPGPQARWQAFQAQQNQGGGGNGGGNGGTLNGSSSSTSTGTVYRPIPTGGGDDLPSTFTPGEICFKASVEVGNQNGVSSREVVAADCITGWDSYCSGDCAGSVGETVQTFDPLGLVGG